MRSILRNVFACTAILLSLTHAPSARAQASPIGFPSTTLCGVTAPPASSGTDPGFPGAWEDPTRYGTGWDLYFTQNSTHLAVFWLTYNAQNQPVWYTNGGASTMSTAANGAIQFWVPLAQAQLLPGPTPGVTYTSVGTVAFAFVPGSSDYAAVRWQLTSPTRQPTDQCIYQYYHHQTGGAQPGVTQTGIVENDSMTGSWYDSTQSGWGVDFNIGSYSGGNSYESDNTLIYDTAGNPVWLEGSAVNPTTAATTIPLIYTKSSANYPVATCSDNTNNACINYFANKGSLNRTFTSASTITATLTAFVNGGITGTTSSPGTPVNWPNTGAHNPASLAKASDMDVVSVNQAPCQIPSGQTTCSLIVSWSSGNANALLYKRDLTTNTLSTTPIGNSNNGQYTDALVANADVCYELHNGASNRPLIFKSAEVKVIAPATSALPAPEEDPPIASDATTGTMQGTASTDGGAAGYNVPIVVPPGRAGIEPKLSLNYNSRNGNGLMGMGWSLSGLSAMHRCPQTPEQDGHSQGVSLTTNDKLCLDGQRLVLMTGAYGVSGATYRTEVDSSTRITQAGNISDNTGCFLVEQQDGRKMHYGGVVSGTSCAVGTGRLTPWQKSTPLSWQLQKVEDRVGNYMLFNYVSPYQGLPEVELSSIQYTGDSAGVGDRQVDFTYGDRTQIASDMSSSYIAGGETIQRSYLSGVTTSYATSSGTRVSARSYTPAYKSSTANGRLEMTSVQECAGPSLNICHPPSTFSYTDTAPASAGFTLTSLSAQLSNLNLNQGNGVGPNDIITIPDIDGDGTADTLVRVDMGSNGNGGEIYQTYLVQLLADHQTHSALDVSSILPYNGAYYADIDGDGRAEALGPITGTGNIIFEKWTAGRGTTPALSSFTQVATTISQANILYAYLVDLHGIGRPDLVTVVTSSANCPNGQDVQYYTNSLNSPYFSGAPTHLFCLGVNYTLNGEQVTDRIDHIADLNGDGLPDFFITTSGINQLKFLGVEMTTLNGNTPSAQFQSCAAMGLVDSAGTVNDECNWTTQSMGSYAAQWLDVNGDGLDDLVLARPNATIGQGSAPAGWEIHLNEGNGTLLASIKTGSTRGLQGGPTGYRYAGRTPVADVDGDGKADLLIVDESMGHSAFAVQMCMFTPQNQIITDGENRCPGTDQNSSNPIASTGASAGVPAGAQSVITCAAYYCSEDPGAMTPHLPCNQGAPPCGGQNDGFDFLWLATETEGSSHGPTFSTSIPAAGTYTRGSSYDMSEYNLRMLKFIQTDFQQFSVYVNPTIALVSRLDNSTGWRGSQQDLYGDGLTDIVSTIGCPAKTVALRGIAESFPSCAVVGNYSDGTNYGPLTLTDGTATSTFAQSVALYANVNNGAVPDLPSADAKKLVPTNMVDTCTSPVVLPGLLDSATNGLGDRAIWGYDTLASARFCSRKGMFEYTTTDVNNNEQYYGDAQHYYFASTMPVVSAMVQSDGVDASFQGFRSAVYWYNQAIYDHYGRGFEGFRGITQETATSSSDRRVRTATLFNQVFPLAGKVASITKSGTLTNGVTYATFDTEKYGYSCVMVTPGSPIGAFASVSCPGLGTGGSTSAQSYETMLTSVNSQLGDLTGSTSSQILTGNTWDNYGNITDQEIDRSDQGSGTDVYVQDHNTHSQNTFDYSSIGNWWLNQLTATTVTTSVGYNTTNHPLPAGISSPVPQVVTTQQKWNANRTLQLSKVQDTTPNERQSTLYCYPGDTTAGCPSNTGRNDGQPVTVLTCLGQFTGSNTCTADPSAAGSGLRQANVVYSSADGGSASSPAGSGGYFIYSTTKVNASNAAYNQTTTMLHEANDGKVTLATDANGVQTAMTYDVFGRTTNVMPALASPSYTAYTTCNGTSCPGGYGETTSENGVAYRVTTTRVGYPTTVAWYDMLGREIQSAERGYKTGTFYDSLSIYDRDGTLAEKSKPFLAGASAVYSTYDYDSMDRMTSNREPATDMDSVHGDFLTSYSYAGRTTTITASTTSNSTCGQTGTNLCVTMTRSKNVLGQFMHLKDANNGTTDYWTEPLGHVIAIEDAQGNVTSALYNELGQRTQSSDPDFQQAWNFTYDALGELYTQIDARKVTTTTLSRDSLGRVTKTSQVPPNVTPFPAGMMNENVLSEWAYDSAPYGIGKLANASLWRGTGQTLPTDTPGTVKWTEAYTYDGASRPVSIVTGVHDLGSNVFTTGTAYDSYGRQSIRTYPSSLRVNTLYGPHGHPGALSNADTRAIYWEANDMDAWGKVTSENYMDGTIGTIFDYASTGQENTASWTLHGAPIDALVYQYDSFGNLHSQNRTAGTSLMNTETYIYDPLQRLSSAARTGGTVSYLYSASGNVSLKSDFATNYSYGAIGSASGCGPHAVISAGAYTYTCDADGNVIGGNTIVSGSTLYGMDNHVRTIARSSGSTMTWTYDVNGQIDAENSPTNGVRQFGPYGYEQTNNKQVHELGPVVVTRTTTGDTITTLLRDRSGSTIEAMDGGAQAGGEANSRTFDAFGAARNADMSNRAHGTMNLADTIHGFTRHDEADDVWLIQTGGRIYDQNLGRFLQVDPIIANPTNSQSLNPYSYVGNNPLSGLDPTGYVACSDVSSSNENVGGSCTFTKDGKSGTAYYSFDSNGALTVGQNASAVSAAVSVSALASSGSVVANALGAGGNRGLTPPSGNTPQSISGEPVPTMSADNSYSLYDTMSQGSLVDRAIAGIANYGGKIVGSFMSDDQYGNSHNVISGDSISATEAHDERLGMGIQILAPITVSGSVPRTMAASVSNRELISNTAQSLVNKGTDFLKGFLRAGELRAFNANPEQGSRFLGQAVHRATYESLQEQFPGQFKYSTIGPDFLDLLSGERIELTTPGQVGAHMARPGYENASYSTYLLPKQP